MSVPFKTSPLLESIGVTHGFFGRQGGVSSGAFDSLNAGPGSRDDPDNVVENRARIARTLGVAPENFVSVWQYHSRDVIVADAPWAITERPKGDAIVTRNPDLACGALAADCGPILLADPKAKIVASCHAGWRGALKGVTNTTIDRMLSLGARRENIVAALGPCISQDNYQVGEDMRAEFDPDDNVFFKPDAPGKFRFDLKGYILMRLGAANLKACEALPDCTYGQPDAYYSYRYNTHNDVADYGRNVAVISAKFKESP